MAPSKPPPYLFVIGGHQVCVGPLPDALTEALFATTKSGPGTARSSLFDVRPPPCLEISPGEMASKKSLETNGSAVPAVRLGRSHRAYVFKRTEPASLGGAARGTH